MGHADNSVYTLRVERRDADGRMEFIEFHGYGELRELIDDIETEAEIRDWFSDDPTKTVG